MSGLLAVIPTYNEKNNIATLVEKILASVPQAGILIVDDCSPDGTGTIANSIAASCRQVYVMHRRNKDGLGRAYRDGFRKALSLPYDYILQMDADFSHDPRYLPLFLEEIKSHDMVLGSRFLETKRPVNVSLLSRMANRYARLVLGMDISDCLGGFKCFRRQLLERIGLERFISDGFIFQTEFIYRAIRLGATYKEIPIVFGTRKSGESKKSNGVIAEALFKMPLLRFIR